MHSFQEQQSITEEQSRKLCPTLLMCPWFRHIRVHSSTHTWHIFACGWTLISTYSQHVGANAMCPAHFNQFARTLSSDVQKRAALRSTHRHRRLGHGWMGHEHRPQRSHPRRMQTPTPLLRGHGLQGRTSAIVYLTVYHAVLLFSKTGEPLSPTGTVCPVLDSSLRRHPKNTGKRFYDAFCS